jgi:molybdenum ABC transporter molybdate-binding protein
MNLAKTAFLASVALLIGLTVLLYSQMTGSPGRVGPPLVVYCAEALRVPMEAIKVDFEKETKQPVELRYEASHTILAQMQVSGQGDVFLPADESYLALAQEKDLIAEVLPLATMHPVVVTRPGFERAIKSWRDVVAPGVKLGLANPDAAAIGKVVRDHLRKQGLWDAVIKHQPTMLGKVSDVGTAVQLGTIDVGVIWDAVATNYPKVAVVDVPELHGVTAQVPIAVTKRTTQSMQALRFARFAAARDRGLQQLKKHGFMPTADADRWAMTPELVVYAGSMLRPAIEKTIDEFQKREGARITTVYNGCGILVGQMKTKERPDVYFSCDTQFMNQVRDLFGEPTVVSNNQLVIAVPKGNKHNLQALKDLAKPGLKVGVGHEQQCALGAITRETFLKTGVYADVQRNIAVQAPSGDLLIVQLRAGSLDVVVCYQSNVTPHSNEIDAVPVTGIPCAKPEQPLAIGNDCPYPQLAQRLAAALQSAESKRRFEELGFGWEVK